MPLLLLERLRRVERAWVQRVREHAAEPVVQTPRAREMAVLEQARADRDVGRHFRPAFVDRPHRVRDLESDIPDRGKETLDRCGVARVRIGVEQDQQIDVGMRKELPAPESPDGKQRRSRRQGAFGPDPAHDPIHQARMFAQQPGRVGRRKECL